MIKSSHSLLGDYSSYFSNVVTSSPIKEKEAQHNPNIVVHPHRSSTLSTLLKVQAAAKARQGREDPRNESIDQKIHIIIRKRDNQIQLEESKPTEVTHEPSIRKRLPPLHR